MEILQPPLELTAFLDRLHAAGQRVVPGSLIWVKHPTRPGWMVAGVRVVEDRKDERIAVSGY